jgi:hypothetical protein
MKSLDSFQPVDHAKKNKGQKQKYLSATTMKNCSNSNTNRRSENQSEILDETRLGMEQIQSGMEE